MEDNMHLTLTIPEPLLTKPFPIKKHIDSYVKNAKDWRDVRNKDIPPFNTEVWLLVNSRTMALAELVGIREVNDAYIYEWFVKGQTENITVVVPKTSPEVYRPGFYWRDDIVVPKEAKTL